MSVDDRLRQLFGDVFGVDPSQVKDGDSPDQVESWDSVAHLSLVFAIEAEFDIQFDAEEIPELVSCGGIRDRVSELESGAP